MYVIKKSRPDHGLNVFEYLTEERGYAGPVYGYNIETAALYKTKEDAEHVINYRLKNHRHHKSKEDGGYGLETWSIYKLDRDTLKKVKGFQDRRQEYQWYYRKKDAERLLKGSTYIVIDSREK